MKPKSFKERKIILTKSDLEKAKPDCPMKYASVTTETGSSVFCEKFGLIDISGSGLPNRARLVALEEGDTSSLRPIRVPNMIFKFCFSHELQEENI